VRKHSHLKALALALPLAVLANGCILIPEIEDRVVELAVGHATILGFTASGSSATHNDANTINLKLDVSLDQILSDNGIDASDVKDVKLASVAYRVTVPQTGRSINNGTVEFLRHATSTPPIAPGTSNPTGGYTQLVTAFNASVASTTGWIAVNLDPAGVTALNSLLADFLTEAKGGAAATNTFITYHVNGTTSPAPPPDVNFSYEIKLELTIVGAFKTTVVN